MTNYPYVDIAVLEAIRRPFAAGDALVIVTRDLATVVWANGVGLELFGLGRLDIALSGDAALDDIQRRQIVGSVPVADEERVVHLRFVQGPQTVLLPVHVSVILLPDSIEAVLLRIPSGSLKSRVQAKDTLEAIRGAGSYAAFIKPGARLISGAEDLAALELDQEDLARMMREVAGENDRLVKRQIRSARGEFPAALARLTDEDGLHLLVVIEPEDLQGAAMTENAPVFTQADQPEIFLAGNEEDTGFFSYKDIETEPLVAESEGVSGDEFIAEPLAPEPTADDLPLEQELANADDRLELAPANTAPLYLPQNDLQPAGSPVRFAWKTDAEGRFVEISDGLLIAVNANKNDVLGQALRALVKEGTIIDNSGVVDLFDKQGMWSQRTMLWPNAASGTAVPIEIAGLPVFGRDRIFEGFRGFGIARPDMAEPYRTPQPEPFQAEGNVVPFGRRAVPPVAGFSAPTLDANEQEAFAEIGARLRDQPNFEPSPQANEGQNFQEIEQDVDNVPLRVPTNDVASEPASSPQGYDEAQANSASIFSKLPLPVLVYSGEALHFANTAFLELSGYPSVAAIIQAGGLDVLFGDDKANGEDNSAGMQLTRADGSVAAVSAHLQSVPWGEGKALMLAVASKGEPDALEMTAPTISDSETMPEMAAAQQQIEELTAILDTATDGVVVLDAKGNIRSLNNAAQALFGYDEAEIAGQPLNSLLAIESHRAANDYMSGLVENGVASVLNDGRDMIGREREGRFIPIFVNIARLSSSEGFCAVIRDITNWKRAEEQLTTARRDAEFASSNKTEFLAKISHEIRTPLNAIIGFSDVMINEQFGPLGNDRYKNYVKDINNSGNLVLSLVNDLLNISKIEAGGESFDFRAVDLNAVVQEAVAIMQPQAERERVLIRTSFGYDLPQLVADERSIKQIVLNLVSNAIRFTDAGGQVIVSTNYEANGDLTLKVRDTGIGMNETELEDALKPYRQVGHKPESEAGGSGLGLPLARTLTESNKGDFKIRSTPGEGTVIEIAFPASRVLAG